MFTFTRGIYRRRPYHTWYKYAGGKNKLGYSIQIESLCYEYSNLEYVHVHVINRVNQAEFVTRIIVTASQEYVNTYSTRMRLALSQTVYNTKGARAHTHRELI